MQIASMLILKYIWNPLNKQQQVSPSWFCSRAFGYRRTSYWEHPEQVVTGGTSFVEDVTVYQHKGAYNLPQEEGKAS